MSGFDRLPNELKDHIFGYVTPAERLHTLRFVSQDWNSLLWRTRQAAFYKKDLRLICNNLGRAKSDWNWASSSAGGNRKAAIAIEQIVRLYLPEIEDIYHQASSWQGFSDEFKEVALAIMYCVVPLQMLHSQNGDASLSELIARIKALAYLLDPSHT